MKSIKVSIIIPVYNGSNYLREAIESALGQTYKNCEVIVVNDGSDDGGATEEIILSFGNKIRYIFKKNGGVASALNVGIDHMEGEYFSWLSHDDLYYPNKIDIQMKALRERGVNKGIVNCSNFVLEQKTDYKYYNQLTHIYNCKDLESGFFAIWMSLINGCSLLIHRSYFQSVGNFDETLLTTQDYDLWFRMLQKEQLIYVDQPLVIYRDHQEQGSKTIKEYERDRNDLFIKYLNKVEKDQILKAFSSEYQFYSIVLDRFRIVDLYDCMDFVRARIEQFDEPKDICKEVEELRDTIQRAFKTNVKEYYIFGCGNRGRLLKERLSMRGIRIQGFIDNEPSKQGQVIDGVPCFSLDKIQASGYGIIIAVQDYQGIIKQLEYENIENYILEASFEKQLLYTGIRKDCIFQGKSNEMDR